MNNDKIRLKCGGRGCAIDDYVLPFGKHIRNIVGKHKFVHQKNIRKRNDIP